MLLIMMEYWLMLVDREIVLSIGGKIWMFSWLKELLLVKLEN